MLVIDGSLGEGGGQVLRTSLTLSVLTRRPIRLERIRARRSKPGLRRQHLTCVEAAARIGCAEVEGASLGSGTVTFSPQELVPGEFAFEVGTAGSTALVLQTVLPALATAAAPSQVTLRGGTHNPLAPPFEFLERAYLPLLGRMGAPTSARLDRHGFYPKGGGCAVYRVEPTDGLQPLELLERGPLRSRRATALLSRLDDAIGERELAVVERRLGWPESALRVERVRKPRGPGNALLLEVEHEHVTEVITSYGARGKPAERVAREAAEEARTYLRSSAAVGTHLADQLLLLLAIAGGGALTTLEPSGHTQTQIELIPRFLDVRIAASERGDGTHLIEVSS